MEWRVRFAYRRVEDPGIRELALEQMEAVLGGLQDDGMGAAGKIGEPGAFPCCVSDLSGERTALQLVSDHHVVVAKLLSLSTGANAS
jgi:hypothetical protein